MKLYSSCDTQTIQFLSARRVKKLKTKCLEELDYLRTELKSTLFSKRLNTKND